ncbi:MAG: family 16 glycoside hydrolase, partial [Pirellulales bacterium]
VGQPPKITTWINDVKISQFDGERFEAPNYDKTQVAETLGSEGSIAVQVHGGTGWPKGAKCRWKNIKIRHLTTDP